MVEEETEGQENEGREPAVAADAEPQRADEPDAQDDRERLEQLRERLQKKFH